MTTENHRSDICYWCCPNCGQVHFSDSPPDMCAFCRDFTTWERVSRAAPPDDDVFRKLEQGKLF
ncbi:MAG: hypothetical protein H7Y11_11515 [Armatimonadetes bacterium]|nr:hypothetical protein [Anaerolineae bacterium]